MINFSQLNLKFVVLFFLFFICGCSGPQKKPEKNTDFESYKVESDVVSSSIVVSPINVYVENSETEISDSAFDSTVIINNM